LTDTQKQRSSASHASKAAHCAAAGFELDMILSRVGLLFFLLNILGADTIDPTVLLRILIQASIRSCVLLLRC